MQGTDTIKQTKRYTEKLPALKVHLVLKSVIYYPEKLKLYSLNNLNIRMRSHCYYEFYAYLKF
jgi:hypothetical protein